MYPPKIPPSIFDMKKQNIISKTKTISNQKFQLVMFNSKDYKNIAVSEAFQTALNSEKYASKQIGSNPAIEVGMVVTGKKLDFFPNVTNYGEDAYNDLDEAQQRRCTRNDDGTYSLDNSFFGMQCEGALGRVSFTSLVGYSQYGKRLTAEDKKELAAALKKAGKTEKDIVCITPGSVDFVAQQVGKTMLGKPATIAYQKKWAKGTTPAGATRPLAFDQRMDVYCI